MVGNKCKSSNNYANNTNSCKYKKTMKQLHIFFLFRPYGANFLKVYFQYRYISISLSLYIYMYIYIYIYIHIYIYTSGILVKLMHLSQPFFHMLTPKTQMKLNINDCKVVTWMFLWAGNTNLYTIYISPAGECAMLGQSRAAAQCREWKLH